MRKRCATRSPGIVGCLDPEGARWRVLADWCIGEGARKLCAEGAFRVWSWNPDGPGLHRIETGELHGVLVGEIFRSASPAASAGAPPCPAADLLAAYRRRGPGCLFEQNGQLALFLWDRARGEAVLFRDASATRPLYFARLNGHGLVFSDDLDLLAASPLVERRLAHRSIHEFLRFLDISPPNTIYEDITAAEPGLLYRMGKHLIREEPGPRPSVGPSPTSLEEAADALEERLATAVSARLDRSGTTVSLLSGGVDSSLVCALAASTGAPVEAVTVGFEETGFDESHIARRVAAHIGVPHQVLAFPMSTYREAFDELTACVPYPSADPAGLPTLLAFKAAVAIGTAALDGTGADTLFGLMPARHQRLAVELGALLPRPFRRLVTRGLKIMPGLAGYAPLVDFDDPEEVLIRWRGWSCRELERLCAEPVSLDHTQFYRLFRRFPRNAHLERYSALLGNLPDDRIHQAAELTGMDVRFPYVDPAVTEWVRHLDLDLRYQPDEPKRVLKAVLARHVPRGLWDFPKHGFDFPFLQLMTADDCALVRTYLDPDLTSPWGLFAPAEVLAARDALIRADRHSAFAHASPAFRTWALVVLFAWLENHFRDR